MKNILMVLLVLLIPATTQASVKEYIRDYSYHAEDFDSKYTSRVRAIDGVKQSLIEELGTYVRSVFSTTQDSEGRLVASHDIVTLTAGIISTKILEERWDRINYYVRASMTADKDDVLRSLEKLENDYRLEESLRESQDELEEARETIAALQLELQQNREKAGSSRLNDAYQHAAHDLQNEYQYQHALKLVIDDRFDDALKTMQAAANDGYPRAQSRLGHMYERGLGTDVDYEKAAEWYLKAIENGDITAYARLGYLYERGLGVRQDYSRAAELYKVAAERDNYHGLSRLGNLYQIGQGVEKDTAKALELYLKSVENHMHGRGYTSLGYMYEKGIEVELDYRQAIEWYNRAIDRGNPRSMARLAWLYVKGRGVETNYDKARSLAERAVKYNNPFGLAVLGYIYEKGLGVDKDRRYALELYRRGADQRGGAAMFRLGNMYQKGIAVDKDIEEAVKWYRLAEAAGNTNARERLTNLGR